MFCNIMLVRCLTLDFMWFVNVCVCIYAWHLVALNIFSLLLFTEVFVFVRPPYTLCTRVTLQVNTGNVLPEKYTKRVKRMSVSMKSMT